MKTIIQIPTGNLAQSKSFYKRLAFKELNDNLVTDGKVLIEINNDKYARAGLKCYNTDWTPILDKLKSLVNLVPFDQGHLFSLPSGVWVYLIDGDADLDFQPEEKSYSALGNCAGFSLETADIKKSIALFQILGFKITMGAVEQGWIALANDKGFGVSLMVPLVCPHLFFNPSLSYFNGKENLSVIAKIKELNIPIAEEITHFNDKGIVDNIILRDPSGLGFFIFSD